MLSSSSNSSGPHPNHGGAPQMQFRPQDPPQSGQQFTSIGSQQYCPPGPPPPPGMGSHLGMPPNMHVMGSQSMPPSSQPLQYSLSPLQQIPLRPPLPLQPQSSQGMPMPYSQHPRAMPSGSLPQQHQQHNMSAVPGNPGMPQSSFGFTSSLPFPQAPNLLGMAPAPFRNIMHPPPIQPMEQVKQPWSIGSSKIMASVTPQSVLPAGVHSELPVASTIPVPALTAAAINVPGGPSDWQEHTASDGRRYYHNKRTKLSSWEKPAELMTAMERADASTVWKEFTTSDGRKYYHNKVTKQSTWTMPEEMKAAREQVETPPASAPSAPGNETSLLSAVPPPSIAAAAMTPTLLMMASPKPIVVASMNPPTPAFMAAREETHVEQSRMVATSTFPSVANVSATPGTLNSSEAMKDAHRLKNSKEDEEEASARKVEESKNEVALTGNVSIAPQQQEKPSTVVEEPLNYGSKTEAKNAFKELLEFVRVESDWTWDQAMRLIINDKRYGALKTLGERKQSFNEYLAQRKKLEAEEKRLKQKKAREDFLSMLEECKELTSSMRWSKAITLFEDDQRFLAVEKEREREELFEDFLVDLERKERDKAREERKKNLAEYRMFLESCDFIKANSQWRKIQDKMEDDERCCRLHKIDRLEMFQEYIRDLEKEEEEEKKVMKEQLRRKERKHRDDFRSLMEEHKLSGLLNARTLWRDYLVNIKDHLAYQAVATNTSGSTPKELFEDFAEELDKQFYVEKGKVKDIIRAGKIVVTSTWSFDKFRATIAEAADSGSIAESNLKLVFDDLLERAKEKEEKEAKKRRRLEEDFLDLLRSMKPVTANSTWEDSRTLIEDSPEYRAIHEEQLRRKIFEDYITHLQQQRFKEKERKRDKDEKMKSKKENEKERRKDKEKERESETETEKDKEKIKRGEKDVVNNSSKLVNSFSLKEEKKKDKLREKDRTRKKRHRSSSEDDLGSDREGKGEPKSSIDYKKPPRKHGAEFGSDTEAKYKRYRRDRDRSKRNAAPDEFEDGELGEDGEIR